MDTSHQIPNQDIKKENTLSASSILQIPTNFAPNAHDSDEINNENNKRNVREVFEAGFQMNLNKDASIEDTCHKENHKRNARQVFDSDFNSKILNKKTLIQDLNDFESPKVYDADFNLNILKQDASIQGLNDLAVPKELTLNAFNEDGSSRIEGERNVREILDSEPVVESKQSNQDDISLVFDKLGGSTNLASEIVGENRNSNEINPRNVREITGTGPIIQSGKIAPGMVDEDQNFKEVNHRNVRGVDDTGPIIESGINPEMANENLNSKEITQRNVREIDSSDPMVDLSEIDPKIDENENFKETNYRNVREIDPMIGILESKINLKMDENQNFKENSQRHAREIDDSGPSIESDVFNQDALLPGSNEMKILTNLSPNSLDEDLSLKENNGRNARDVGKGSMVNLNNVLGQDVNRLAIPTNYMGDSLSEDGILKEKIQRNVREILGSSDVDSNILKQGAMGSNVPKDVEDYHRNVREVLEPYVMDSNVLKQGATQNNAPEEIGNIQRNVRGILEPFVIDSNILKQGVLGSDVLGVEKNQRSVREISNSSKIFGSSVQRNVREISNEGEISKAKVLEQPAVESVLNTENLEKTPENLVPVLLKFEDENLKENEERSVREIANGSFMSEKKKMENFGSNFRDIIDESRNLMSNNVPNQGPINGQLFGKTVGDISDSSQMFESNQEAIDGQRNIREISDKSSTFDRNAPNTVDENLEDTQRMIRSCKKSHSHHKTNASDKFVYEKPEPVQASLQMMNLRIVKSKDDLKFLDDVTDSSLGNSEGEGSGGKQKKKNKVCRIKHLHVLQPLKKSSKIVESAKKKHNLKNSTSGFHSGETVLKVLKATLDSGEEEEGEGGGEEGDEDDEGMEFYEEFEVNKEVNKDGTKKPYKKQKLFNENINNVKMLKNGGRLVGTIVSSPLVAENVPKRVFGGAKKFVMAENRLQNLDTKNRKALFKKDHFKNDDPTFLAGLKLQKNLENKMEDNDSCRQVENDDRLSSKFDEPCRSVVGIPNDSERLKLKDLQNVSEASNDGNKQNNNFYKNAAKCEREGVGDEEGAGEEEEDEEEESEEEDRRLNKSERNDEGGENADESDVESENDKFEDNVEKEENEIDENA